MVDYLTTVAVSVTAGTAAIVAFAPGLSQHVVVVDVVMIVLLMTINLRGVREAGAAFVAPDLHLHRLARRCCWSSACIHLLVDGAPTPRRTCPDGDRGRDRVPRAARVRRRLHGDDRRRGDRQRRAGVHATRPRRTPRATLITLAVILATLFLGVAVPRPRDRSRCPSERERDRRRSARVRRQLAALSTWCRSPPRSMLMLAANTSFNGFPRLAAVMAADDWIAPPAHPPRLPARLLERDPRDRRAGDRCWSSPSAARTHALIPLFAVGVFLCFTLSQAGMVRHWRRERTGPPGAARRRSTAPARSSPGIVTLIVVATKFTSRGPGSSSLLVPLLGRRASTPSTATTRRRSRTSRSTTSPSCPHPHRRSAPRSSRWPD